MKKLSHLEDHLGYWLRFVSNHVSSSFKKKLETYDVGVAEWVVLRSLHENTMLSPGILAEMTGMTRGAMSKLLDRLVHKELVERIESSKDRRFQEVRLAMLGSTLLPKLATLADINDQEFFGHLSKKEREPLIKMLKEIVSLQGWDQIPIS